MSREIRNLALAFLAAFALMASVAGYWAVVRQTALLARPDNPRRLLLERRAPRGPILDRAGSVLAESRGAPGDYQRVYPYPDLAPVLGYVSPLYGAAGVEAAADATLHGDDGGDPLTEWWLGLLGRPPAGRAVRLTLDLRLQRLADAALGDRAGAVVLLEPASGEVLALASHPAFDPNQLDAQWQALVADARAPLLNRATTALYQPGGALAPAILAAALQAQVTRPGEVFDEPGTFVIPDGITLTCRLSLAAALTPAEALRAGCPGPLAELGRRLGARRLEQLFTDLRLLEAPAIGLPAAAARPDFSDPAALAAGQGSLTLTPLHLALVTAALARHGEMPAPRLIQAAAAADGAWVAWPPADHPVAAFAPDVAGQVKAWLREGHAAEVLAGAAGQRLAWFSGFAPFDDPRLVVVVLLEDGAAEAAARVGQALLTEAGQMGAASPAP